MPATSFKFFFASFRNQLVGLRDKERACVVLSREGLVVFLLAHASYLSTDFLVPPEFRLERYFAS